MSIFLATVSVGLVGSVIYYHDKTKELKSEKEKLAENYREISDNYENLQEEQVELKKRYDNLEENNQRLKESRRELWIGLRKTEENLGEVIENHRDLNENYRKLEENFDSLENEFKKIKLEKEDLKEDYISLQDVHEGLSENYENLYESYNSLYSSHEVLQENYQFVESELKLLRDGDRYEMHDPTYSELADFLGDDTTDENEYNENVYVCFDFSKDLIANAMDVGMMAGYVRITYWENHQYYTFAENFRSYSAHAIVAFKTVDEGLVYVEPQNDVIMKDLNVGDSYWDEVERSSSLDYVEWPKLVITDIDVIW